MIRFWRRRATAVGGPRRAASAGRRLVPALDALEARELQAVITGRTVVNVHPAVLPPSGQFVPVHIYGTIGSTRKDVPRGFFQVTDEYRRVEPAGPLALRRVADYRGFPAYAFDFTVMLQARRSNGTPDGRHYDILIGAQDFDNTDGKTVTVVVPKTYHPAKAGHAAH